MDSWEQPVVGVNWYKAINYFRIAHSGNSPICFLRRGARSAQRWSIFVAFHGKKAFSNCIAYKGRVLLVTFCVCACSCVFVCVCLIVWRHVCRPQLAYTASRPVPTGPGHAKMTDNSSRSSLVVSRWEFADKGAETWDSTCTNCWVCGMLWFDRGCFGLRSIRGQYGFSCSMLLYEHTYIYKRLIDETHTQRHWPGSGPMCRAAVTTAAAYTFCIRFAAADTSPAVLRVQHRQSYGYPHYFSLKTLLGVRRVVIWQALLGYVIGLYAYIVSFSHADLVLVIGGADCECSKIPPKIKGDISATIRHAAVRVPISGGWSSRHAQRHLPRSVTCCFCIFCCMRSSLLQEIVGQIIIHVETT